MVIFILTLIMILLWALVLNASEISDTLDDILDKMDPPKKDYSDFDVDFNDEK